jgi:hypothetical protein
MEFHTAPVVVVGGKLNAHGLADDGVGYTLSTTSLLISQLRFGRLLMLL